MPRISIGTLANIMMTAALTLGATPRIGDRAPDLAIETMLQGPADDDLSWQALKGQAMVLEFWATWCGPCVGAIPHFNELAEEFSGQPVRFLSITDEEVSTIEPFLKSQPISGWIGLDLDRSVFRDYSVTGIPATVLVDKEGVIQAVTHPRHVTKTVLGDLVAGRRPDVPEKSTGTFLAVGDDGPEPVFQVLIRPSTSDRSGMSRSRNEIKIISFLPEHILPVAFDSLPGQFLIEAELPNQKYDVVVNTAGRQDLLAPMMQEAVSAALGVEAVLENRTVDAYVLRRSAETRLEPLPSIEGSYSRWSGGELEATSVKGLARMVASLLDRPVLDETRLHGSYRIKLKFDPEEDSSIARAIKSTLGLELVQARRQVRMLIVRNSGNSGKREPWILLGVSVLLVLLPVYLKRRRDH
ncbi:MAG: TIGR03435 family protein [Candidatus Aminicenantes bacterium]|nr:TIGR03435 family protein [Candidatus Aminicenantes bacterium]